MTKQNFTTKNRGELEADLAAQRAKLAQMRFDLADKRLKKTSDVRAARRDIARIMTALRTAK